MKTAREKELKYKKDTVEKVVFMYCRRKHDSRKKKLCNDCSDLLQYAHKRAEHCPHIEKGVACRKCQTPCYKPDMKNKMRTIMSWGGPRMILRHPIAAIRYIMKS